MVRYFRNGSERLKFSGLAFEFYPLPFDEIGCGGTAPGDTGRVDFAFSVMIVAREFALGVVRFGGFGLPAPTLEFPVHAVEFGPFVGDRVPQRRPFDFPLAFPGGISSGTHNR